MRLYHRKTGRHFLIMLIGSIDYATDIGSSLKENMYWAMKRIAEGYIKRISNHLDKNNPVTLVCIQKNTMILLYRFLFLLYAEGKECSILQISDTSTITVSDILPVILLVDRMEESIKNTIQSKRQSS